MSKPKPKPSKPSLCYRCEHRAQALEDKLHKCFEGCPRYQCGQPEYSAIDCYMFEPTKPPILAPSESERKIKWFPGRRGRPRFIGGMLSGREEAVEVPEMVKVVVDFGKGKVLWFWQPQAAVEPYVAIDVSEKKGGTR